MNSVPMSSPTPSTSTLVSPLSTPTPTKNPLQMQLQRFLEKSKLDLLEACDVRNQSSEKRRDGKDKEEALDKELFELIGKVSLFWLIYRNCQMCNWNTVDMVMHRILIS